MEIDNMSLWDAYSQADYSQAIEKKGQFDYLSWAHCWKMMKDYDPCSRYDSKVIGEENGKGYSVEVTLHWFDKKLEDDCTHTETLAVTDFRNQSVEFPDSSQIENTKKRTLAKAISAASGYGLGLWMNEDIKALDYRPYTERDIDIKADKLARNKVFNKEETSKIKLRVKEMDQEKAETYLANIKAMIKNRELKENGSK